jgi:hypothetical protein
LCLLRLLGVLDMSIASAVKPRNVLGVKLGALRGGSVWSNPDARASGSKNFFTTICELNKDSASG